eukprot:808152-Rhodomonas_salina.1
MACRCQIELEDLMEMLQWQETVGLDRDVCASDCPSGVDVLEEAAAVVEALAAWRVQPAGAAILELSIAHSSAPFCAIGPYSKHKVVQFEYASSWYPKLLLEVHGVLTCLHLHNHQVLTLRRDGSRAVFRGWHCGQNLAASDARCNVMG